MGRRNRKSNKNITTSTNEYDNKIVNVASITDELKIITNTVDENAPGKHEFIKNQTESKTSLEEINCHNHEVQQSQHETDVIALLLSELKLKKVDVSIKKDRSKINNERRKFYINYLCQVCKNVVNKSEYCRRCHVISYCSTEHRREHWPLHADLCGAIQEKCKTENKKHILEHASMNNNADMFRSYCYNLMQACERKIERKLEEWEVELFLFPNVCDTCYNWKNDELVRCSECNHTSYCKDNPQHLRSSHKNYCHSLVIYKNFLLHQREKGLIKTFFPETYLNEEISFENKNLHDIIRQSKNNLNELEYAQLTESATGPLTAVYSIKLIKSKYNKPLTESLTIHVIGAEKHFELSLLEKWEIFFLHYFNKLKTLNIVFIGPEMNISNKEEMDNLKDIKICKNCLKQNRKINFEFHDKMFYHNYTQNLHNYKKPDLICAFNAGLYRTTGFNERDSWPETIRAMFKIRKIPVLVTAYTSVEIVKDIKRVTEIQKCEVIKMPSQNPFSSVKPNLNFVSYEDAPVIFKNYYFMLLMS